MWSSYLGRFLATGQQKAAEIRRPVVKSERLVEAAGVEPASGERFTAASTCVSFAYFSRLSGWKAMPPSSQSRKYPDKVRDQPCSGDPLNMPLIAWAMSRAHGLSVAAFKLLVRSYRWQL